MRRITMCAIAAGVAAAAAAAAVAPAAHAGDAPLLVSHDGVTYAADPTFEMFTDAPRVVPGDELSDGVWVKNVARTAGRVRIDIVSAKTDDPALAAKTTVTFTSEGIPARTANIADAVAAEGCLIVGGDLVLQPGETAHIGASLRLDPSLGDGAVGNEGALGSFSFDVRAILADASVPASEFPGTSCNISPAAQPSPSGSALPATGASSVAVPLAIGVGAVAIGTFVAVARQRRKSHDR